MDFNQINRDLRNKIYHPVYFLTGDEPYYIDEISDYIETQVLEEHERDFNQTILYGLESNVVQIIAEAKRFPMMSDYQVVIVKEAQLVKNLLPREMPDKPEEHPLFSYMLNPQKSTILIFCYKYRKLDKRKATSKFIQKHGVFFQSEKLRDYHIPKWIEDHVRTKGYGINPRTAALLSEYLGADLGKIVNEVEKLTINLASGSEITPEIIERNIGISKDYNIFEFQDALGKRQLKKALNIAAYFASNPKAHPIQIVTATLYSYFSKLLLFHRMKNKHDQKAVAAELRVHPFFVKDYQTAAHNYPYGKLKEVFSELRSLDVKAKGVGNSSTSQQDLMKEFYLKRCIKEELGNKYKKLRNELLASKIRTF